MPETILLTGATGFIGFAILKRALQDGHRVIFTARSASKAQSVQSHPAIKNLVTTSNLKSVVIPDIAAAKAFDEVLSKDAGNGVTSVLHVGSPVPKGTEKDFRREIFEPTVRSVNDLLAAVARNPAIKRVVITTSWYGYFHPEFFPPAIITARSRIPLPDPIPVEIGDASTAYCLGKRVVLGTIDQWVEENKPSFKVFNVPLGWVFGHQELWTDLDSAERVPSSNNVVWPAFTGGNMRSVPAIVSYLGDVVEVHMRAAVGEVPDDSPMDLGQCVMTDWEEVWKIAEASFPEAVERGLLKKGAVENVPLIIDASETERVLGIKFRGFEVMIREVVGQWLGLHGHSKG